MGICFCDYPYLDEILTMVSLKSRTALCTYELLSKYINCPTNDSGVSYLAAQHIWTNVLVKNAFFEFAPFGANGIYDVLHYMI